MSMSDIVADRFPELNYFVQLHSDSPFFAIFASSGFAFRKFVVCGFVDDQRDFLIITGAGLRALGSFTPLPKGAALRAQMLNDSRLKKVERELLRVFFDAYPDAVSKEDALARSGYKSSGDTNTAFRKFVVAGWTVAVGRGDFRAADELFEE